MSSASPSALTFVRPSRLDTAHPGTVWSKVPEATLGCWVSKVLTTAWGSGLHGLGGRVGTTADVLGALAVVASMAWQVSTTRSA